MGLCGFNSDADTVLGKIMIQKNLYELRENRTIKPQVILLIRFLFISNTTFKCFLFIFGMCSNYVKSFIIFFKFLVFSLTFCSGGCHNSVEFVVFPPFRQLLRLAYCGRSGSADQQAIHLCDGRDRKQNGTWGLCGVRYRRGVLLGCLRRCSLCCHFEFFFFFES